MKARKKRYSKRSDADKLRTNWQKTLGLLERSEFSMAIIRAATCAEIAANIVVRAELIQRRQLEAAFVETLLRWANGLQGKFSRLILPILADTPRSAKFRKLQRSIQVLNNARNEIAHTGSFAKSATARKLIFVAHALCTALTRPYEVDLHLPKP
jgi:hypothetical protein